jgi:hypothetical protein
MKSVRGVLFFLMLVVTLFGVAACLAESTDDGLNPQPLPPAHEPEPGDPNQDKNGAATGAGGSSGSSGAGADNPNSPPPGTASDAGAADGAHLQNRLLPIIRGH